MKNITPAESVNRILDQAIARAEAQLQRHSESLKKLKKQERDTKTMEAQVEFYTEQIKELKSRKKRGK